jgi:hypothetical protein
VSDERADTLALVAAEADQLGGALHERGRLPVAGVERLAGAITAAVMRDLDERITLSLEEAEGLVHEAATFAFLVGAKIGARRG